ncbi:MAG: hypothetical protein WC496_01615 [Phycisphaerae bacterium]|jgi:formate hydrogenlyase subunit 3/multisubunit Na+/H+ antiporter MnhD subunit
MIKCPHCGRDIDETSQPEIRWYHSDFWVLFALLCAGPFALRIVCSNPRYKPITKWIISLLVIVVTVIVTIWLYYSLKSTYQTLNQQLRGL